MRKYSFWLAFMLLILAGCKQYGTRASSGFFIPDPSGSSRSTDASEVIYSLQLPTDIAGLFEETGTGFNPDLLIPLERIPLYEDPGRMALLLGAIGVDLSYCRLFERVNESTESYRNLELLGGKLELPGDIFDKSAARLERYIQMPDSLSELISEVYRDVDDHFNEEGQESLASLSLLGGWLEAMHIGVGIYREHNILEMGDRILMQKYALNSLTGLLANHQESLLVRQYIHALDKLKEAFEDVDIRYQQEGFRVDRKEQTFYATVSEITFDPHTLDQICEIITRIREEMIN